VMNREPGIASATTRPQLTGAVRSLVPQVISTGAEIFVPAVLRSCAGWEKLRHRAAAVRAPSRLWRGPPRS
jgi:hypothetical protein